MPLLTLPIKLLSTTITYLNDDVSSICLALTCHHFKEVVPVTLKTTIRRLNPRFCACQVCRIKKYWLMHRFRAVWNFREYRDETNQAVALLVHRLEQPHQPMPKNERFRSTL